jgi:MoxR-like ATPase
MQTPRPPFGSARRAAETGSRWIAEIERALQGKPEVVRKTLICLLARGHLLLEDVPGVGKTTLAHALARSVHAEFRRIQFTSDLLPGDLTGLALPELAQPGAAPRFQFQPGPIFGNIVLADEVNRAGPKTQSALLEAMSERTVSVDGVSHALPNPFFVIATQNPLEHHGTHPLPESQLDRFAMRLEIGYPERHHEARVLAEDPSTHALPEIERVLDLDELRGLQGAAEAVKVDEALIAYLLDLVEATRSHDGLALGASTRGALVLRRTAQASALLDGRDYCIPEDIRDLTVDVLAHRVGLPVRGGAGPDGQEARWILREIVDRVPIPL